ncbi:cytochrome c-552 precursor [mine drainage metagenome]|uniref:Cytochrome c-552 n=1 Tax=mine drainage metagenome TaxID=410659 RepID=A0A1J5PE49_9ZZZZ
MNYRVWVSLGIMGLIAASTALGADSAAQMDNQLCSVCHGRGGTTSSELFPHLAGEPAPYLVNQLKAFRDKTRSDENAKRFMWGIARRLTDENIEQLAAFYESQPAVHQGKISNQAEYDSGKQIFTNGIQDKGVPPCMACHGDKGQGNGTTPRLGGQNEAYLKRQLKVFSGNDRPAATAMHVIVKGLSENDVAAITQYLQAQ